MSSQQEDHKRVLWIEDRLEQIKYSRIMLEKHGYVVEVASSLNDAEQMLSQRIYDVILLDIMLPTGNKNIRPELAGLELLQMIRDNDRYTNINRQTIIVLSAVADDLLRERLLTYGVSSVLKKPVRVDVMIEAIKEATS